MRNPIRHISISGNSSKVESAGRALVALVFLTALWFDPVQPVRNNVLGMVLMAGFLAWSVVLMAIARASWWWDHRLARTAHLIDIAVFVAAVYYTEAPSTDFSSPFMAFAVLLLVKARLRWDLRATAWTALALVTLNLAVSGTMAEVGYAIDLQRVGRRTAYMMLLAVLLVWMGLERRVALDLPFPVLPPRTAGRPDRGLDREPGDARGDGQHGAHPLELLIATALRFAREATTARSAAIAWSAEQEPWIMLAVSADGAGDVGQTRLGPEFLGPEFLGPDAIVPDTAQQPPARAGGGAVLFDSTRQRALAFATSGRRIALRLERPPTLAAHLGIATGISVPITSDAGGGRLLLWDLADPGFDRLTLASQAAGEIGRAFEREERARLAQVVAVNGAVSGVREAIARDLHDSAAQFLAGTMFRLEALRRRMVGEPDSGTVPGPVSGPAPGTVPGPVPGKVPGPVPGKAPDKAPGVDPGAEILTIKNAMRLEQAQLRHLIGQLRRGETADRQTDMGQELTALLGELGAHWGVATTLDCGPEPVWAPITVPVTLGHEVRQLVREGVANAARHGGGDAVRVELASAGAWLWLTIDDNGRGFPPEAVERGGDITLRPRSIAGRVAALGGSLAIESVKPHGARLSIKLPLRPVASEGRVALDPAGAAAAAPTPADA